MKEQWQELKETITEMRDNDGTGTQQDVCKFLVNYMKTLEKQMQQPCEDCISREEMLKYQQYLHGKMSNEENHKLWNFIKGLPSVTPQRPKGKWIATENEEMNIDGYFCSCCDLPMETEERTKYCPNCGAEMSGGEK